MLRRVLLCTVALGALSISAPAQAEDPPQMCAKAWVSGMANVPLGRCFPSDYAVICRIVTVGEDNPVTVGVAVCVPLPTRD